MKKILVPTDFSHTAKHAAIYAIHLAKDLNVETIILYNAYQAPPVLTEATVPVMPVMNIDTMKEISSESMKNFKKALSEEIGDSVQIEDKIEYGILSESLNEIVKSEGIDLVVMGITGASKMEEIFIGSTATSVMKHAHVPVIVVPENYTYNTIRNILFACDYEKVVETIPVDAIRRITQLTQASLHIVNVYTDSKENNDKTYQQELLHSLLADCTPKFYHEENEDFVKGINESVEANQVDLIITIPRKHTFFERLFNEGHTKKLAFHTNVPLMSIHAEQH